MLYHSITDAIGNTPLLKLGKYAQKHRLKADIYGKLEYFNPAGSVKDRVALAMAEDAERRGILKRGATIIEPTSGNTGIGLAMVAAAKGYRLIITMPETMSEERRKMIAAYGAEIVLTPGSEGMKGAIAAAERLHSEIEGSIIAGQFVNPANPAAHRATTGREIWNDLDGKADIFVAGVGTGGTLTGAGGYLKERNPALKIYAVEPAGSPVLSGGKAGRHKIQGIGAGFIPGNLDLSLCDGIITVSDEDAFKTAGELARTEAFLAGISSGAALYAATLLALSDENAGKNIAVVLPDGGDRYLSSDLYKI